MPQDTLPHCLSSCPTHCTLAAPSLPPGPCPMAPTPAPPCPALAPCVGGRISPHPHGRGCSVPWGSPPSNWVPMSLCPHPAPPMPQFPPHPVLSSARTCLHLHLHVCTDMPTHTHLHTRRPRTSTPTHVHRCMRIAPTFAFLCTHKHLHTCAHTHTNCRRSASLAVSPPRCPIPGDCDCAGPSGAGAGVCGGM